MTVDDSVHTLLHFLPTGETAMGLAQETAAKNPSFESAEMSDMDNDMLTNNSETAVAEVKTTAVAQPAKAKKFEMALAEFKDVFPVEAVVGLSMNVPRIKGEQGSCYIGTDNLGSKFRISIESWNMRWLVSPGLDSKDPGFEESKQYIRNAYDKGFLPDGTSVETYINELKEMGYKKASIASYGDIWGMVTWTEKKGAIAPEDQTLHLVQASQTSLGNFTAYCTTQGLLASKGIGKVTGEVEIHAEARSKGTLKYTNFSFHNVK